MRNPKSGDILVISEYYDENEERIIDSAVDLPRMAEVVKVIRGAVFADDIINDYSYQILIGFPDSLDKWRMAVRKGDRLVVTRINGIEIEPSVVTSEEDEPMDDDGLVYISEILVPYDLLSNVLNLRHNHSDDKWEFAEESPHTEKEVAKEVCGDICDSYNDVIAKDDVETEYVPQSFSDFNASSGGGKTLKDYTGVGFTKEELAFKSSHEKALESLTADSLAFSPIEEDDVSVPDNVNHPSHYNRYSREVIESIKGLCTPEEFRGYLKGNIIKYSARYPDKGGIQDIDKLAKYTQFLKEFEIEMEVN